MPTINDQVLVRAAQRGDAEAFAALVDQHRPWLVGVCRAHLSGDHHAAEDVAQECLVRLHATLVQCPDRALSVRPWLSVVAGPVCIDHHRRQSRQPEPVATVPETAAPTEDLFDVDPALAQAWARLTARHREVLHHRELIGLSYEDIATLMTTSSAGVESLLVRARGALRREYRRAGGQLLGCGSFLFLERSVRGSNPRPEAVAHVAGCPACARVLGEVERLAGFLRGVLPPPPPPLPARTTLSELVGRFADRWAPLAPMTANLSHLAVAAMTAVVAVAPLAAAPHAPLPPAVQVARSPAGPGGPHPDVQPALARGQVAPGPAVASPTPSSSLPPDRAAEPGWLVGTRWPAPWQPWPSPRPHPAATPTPWALPASWATPRPWPQPQPQPGCYPLGPSLPPHR